jgi:paraquat-inducible protein B
MSKKANPALVGSFVIGSIILAMATILFLGNLRLNKENYRCVLFFEGSLHGLDIGAPVTYRGVKIGKVGTIEIFFDKRDKNYHIPVYIDIDGSDSHLQDNYLEAGFESPKDFFESLIKKGLQAKLRMSSLITGKLYIEFSFNPEAADTAITYQDKYLRIPTAPSGLEQITQAVESLPIKKLMDKSMAVLNGFEKLVNNPALHSGIDSLNSAVTDFDQLMIRAEKQLAGLEPKISQLLADFSSLTANTNRTISEIAATNENLQPAIREMRTTLTDISKATDSLITTLDTVQGMAAENQELPYQLNTTLAEVRRAARVMGDFADYLQRHPRALLVGPEEENK